MIDSMPQGIKTRITKQVHSGTTLTVLNGTPRAPLLRNMGGARRFSKIRKGNNHQKTGLVAV